MPIQGGLYVFRHPKCGICGWLVDVNNNRNYESKIERTKGQLISKQNCRAVTSTKKRVLGEVTDQQFGFEIY